MRFRGDGVGVPTEGGQGSGMYFGDTCDDSLLFLYMDALLSFALKANSEFDIVMTITNIGVKLSSVFMVGLFCGDVKPVCTTCSVRFRAWTEMEMMPSLLRDQ